MGAYASKLIISFWNDVVPYLRQRPFEEKVGNRAMLAANDILVIICGMVFISCDLEEQQRAE